MCRYLADLSDRVAGGTSGERDRTSEPAGITWTSPGSIQVRLALRAETWALLEGHHVPTVHAPAAPRLAHAPEPTVQHRSHSHSMSQYLSFAVPVSQSIVAMLSTMPSSAS